MTSADPNSGLGTTEEPDPRRWLALAVIACAQLMVVLDATIVNTALPKAQDALHISAANQQWVVTAYTLTFGGLLLLGGRVADFNGRKKSFIIGLFGFALASAIGGAAVNEEMLFLARALQGCFAALLAPAALSMVTVTFTEPHERAKAFGVYGGISAGGAAIGLILGGVLTEYASWRWCLLVNVPVALLVTAAAVSILHESRAHGDTHYDVPGAVTVTLGLASLVYAFTQVEQHGWSSAVVLTFLGIAVALIAAFIAIEMRSTRPLLPLRVVLHRTRGGAYLAMFLTGAGMFAMFLFIAIFLQRVHGFSPLRAGFAGLPFSVGVAISATAASKLLPKVGPRPLVMFGFAMGTIGILWLSQMNLHSTYTNLILPSQIIISLGMGFVFVPLSSSALVGVSNHDAGVASALVNCAQQVGGSLGTALLNTIAASAAGSYAVAHQLNGALAPDAAAHGYGHALRYGAGFFFLALLVTAVLVRAHKEDIKTSNAPEAAVAT